MSDGHFNKAILPHNDYRSGLKVGRAIERKNCEDAFNKTLNKVFPNDDSEQKRLQILFSKELKANKQ